MMGTRLTCVACGASSGLFDVHCTACGVELQPRPTEEQLDSLGLTAPDEGHWESGTTRGVPYGVTRWTQALASGVGEFVRAIFRDL